MKLLRVHVIAASSCGGLLDGFEVNLRPPGSERVFEPFCLIGPNGAGKSQFLQVLAEMFQSLIHACAPEQERSESNPGLAFELEYEIAPTPESDAVRVRVKRDAGVGGRQGQLVVERWDGAEWQRCDLAGAAVRDLLPSKVIAYTSGDNETLSAPFLVSRSAYADEVAEQALADTRGEGQVPEPSLMLIDYQTHLEVLAANLLLARADQRSALLADAGLEDVHSFRCIVQLNPRPGPGKGVQLTPELEEAVDRLRRCATSSDYESRNQRHTFDFLVTRATREAFSEFWDSPFELYTTFHKLAMLNDLAIPRYTRQRFKRQTSERRFASRLPEPQDEDKVFRFERVRFRKAGEAEAASVDYVSLSDGEHQLALLLGTMGMLAFPGVLFLLDEPESHFNPVWRVQSVTRILDLPTSFGARSDPGPRGSKDQECLLTTHAPFVPSDLPRERVLVFSKEGDQIIAERPDVETHGATFDTILDECFRVRPPISNLARQHIDELHQSTDPEAVRRGLRRLGPSVEKVLVADHLRQLEQDADVEQDADE